MDVQHRLRHIVTCPIYYIIWVLSRAKNIFMAANNSSILFESCYTFEVVATSRSLTNWRKGCNCICLPLFARKF